jgi:carboxypeptidase Taq
MNAEQAYAELVRVSREETILMSCLDLLEWDAEVSMPPGGVEHRAEQSALMAGIAHDRSTDPRYDELLHIVENSTVIADPDSPQSVNVRELRREYDRERRLPRRLVEESARVTALASQVWADARKKNDFKTFAPWLDRIFVLAREEADAVGHNGTRYDALLDDYEPGMTSVQLSQLFSRLKTELAPLVDKLRGQGRATRSGVLAREFPLDRQRLFGESVAAALGFNLQAGRLDTAHHPFCTAIGPGDVRIGLRYHARNFARGIFGLLHEVGHALYEQGLDPAHYGTPMGEAASLGMHESQSRLWENQVGRSEGFWRHFYPQLQHMFQEALRGVPLARFRAAINRVKPGVIRIEADEVTYDLHIMIRFELERSLLAGDLFAADVPQAWSELYARYLGVTPKNDRMGCLQDGHWSEGLIGYFPTYTLGNVYAAQLFAAAERTLGPLDDAFAAGDFRGLRGWLHDNVHRHGQRYTAARIVENVTGQPPDASALIESLLRRYLTQPMGAR